MSASGNRLSRLVVTLRAWVTPRWGGPEKAAAFLSKPLPRNVSWLHTLGSLVLVYILFQTLTGILLAFYYSASPQAAYDSVRYVQDELFLGRLLHRLHRYGSGFVIVTAFVHMARSYFLAAYKSPRELLWISGVVLMVLLTLFVFTGQLLPFDQRGYWATVVSIEIASGAPVVGDSIRDLLTGGYGDIGATTLSRFYVLHVCVLPLALFGLIGLHLGILQKTGSAGPTTSGSTGEPTRPFYPGQAAKDVLVAAAGALVLCLVATTVASVETGPASPSSGDYVPRPEWYFLSHYQILKYLPGKWLILGTFVLPNLVLILLLLLPFIDRSPERSLRRRKFATTCGALFCISIITLTAIGIAEAPRPAPAPGVEVAVQDPVQRGREFFFREKNCRKCHTIGGEGGKQGPDLSQVSHRLRPDYLAQWIRNPRAFKPDTEMPSFEGTEDELGDVVQYLLSLE